MKQNVNAAEYDSTVLQALVQGGREADVHDVVVVFTHVQS